MAKKVFSFDDLTSLIGEDYSWRRKELKIIKNQIPSTNSPLQNASLRFAVPILYAHWEGFAKKSCEYYLEFISNKYSSQLIESEFELGFKLGFLNWVKTSRRLNYHVFK